MLTVLRHGNKIAVKNPVTGEITEMINVAFVEEGRSGAIGSMSASSDFLSKVTGQSVGLDTLRVHTHPVISDKINFFPVGKKIEGHINRKIFSTPQMAQQEHVQSRMVDGKPTFFTTYLDDTARADEDFRMTNETLAQINPDLFKETRTRVAEVNVLEHVVAGATGAAQPIQGTETLAG